MITEEKDSPSKNYPKLKNKKKYEKRPYLQVYIR